MTVKKKSGNRYRYSRCDTCNTNTPDTDTRDINTPDTTYSPSPGIMEGHIIIKTLYIGTLNYVKQNGYLKIFIGLVWGRGPVGRGGYLLSNIFGHLKRALKNLIPF